MRRYLFISLILAPLVLSGCSLSPQASDKPTPPNPNNSIWTSADAGKTWVNNYPAGQKVDISGVDVISMVINPFDAKNVYVGLRGPGILETNDGGATWNYMNFQSQKVYGLDIDPTDGRIIYASGVWQERGKIFKSTDAGTTWSEIYTAAANGPLVISLIIDRKIPNTVYATTSDSQIIKATDAGTSWQTILNGKSPALKIVIDRGNRNLVYAMLQNGNIMRSRDGGVNFEDVTKKLAAAAQSGSHKVNVIETDPTYANWVYAAGAAGLFVSKNAGDDWKKIEILNKAQSFPVKALAISPANSNNIVYGAAKAAYRSLDGGQNWDPFQFTLPKSVNVIKYSTADPTQLYLGFSK